MTSVCKCYYPIFQATSLVDQKEYHNTLCEKCPLGEHPTEGFSAEKLQIYKSH